MHPIDHYETLRRGREELLKRAEYERMARKAKADHILNRNIYHAATWIGIHLVSAGKSSSNLDRSLKPGSLIHLILQRDLNPCSAQVIRVFLVTKARKKGQK